jgi:hypothetical protein
VKKVKTQSPFHGIRFEGVLLGVGLTLILLGALGMFIPGPAFMPMSRHTHIFSWDAQSSNFVGELYVQMLPSQFAQARLQVEEGGNVSSIEIQVFSNYQKPAITISCSHIPLGAKSIQDKTESPQDTFPTARTFQ